MPENLPEDEYLKAATDGAIALRQSAEGIAGSAVGAEEALRMCRDLATAEDLGDDDYAALLRMVDSMTDWELAALDAREH